MKTIKYTKGDIELDIRLSIEENTVWMNQNDLAILFKKDRKAISKHIVKLDGFIQENPSVSASKATTASDGKSYNMSYFNLDVIERVGNKIDPLFTNEFISWCKEQLDKEKNQLISTKSNYIRFEDDGIVLDVRVIPEEDTVYLSQEQLSILFDTSVPNISMHIKNIYESCELTKKATVKEFLIVQNENGRNVTRNITQYNLDLIISLGYRVNTKKGIAFRMWATKTLREYLLKGYVINEQRALVTNENYLNLIHRVDSMDNRISVLEKEKDINLPTNVIIDEDKEYEAISFLSRLIESANKDIVLIDAYSDIQTLLVLSYKKKKVNVKLITSNKNRLNESHLKDFNGKYKNLSVYINDSFHDRFLIIDGITFYSLGTSINYAGKRISTIRKIIDEDTSIFLTNKICKIIGSATNI